jgi:hypothetical protein
MALSAAQQLRDLASLQLAYRYKIIQQPAPPSQKQPGILQPQPEAPPCFHRSHRAFTTAATVATACAATFIVIASAATFVVPASAATFVVTARAATFVLTACRHFHCDSLCRHFIATASAAFATLTPPTTG